MNAEKKFFVGQEVWLCPTSGGAHYVPDPQRVTITRVGRTLLYIERHGREVAYRQQTGYSNDGYSHTRILTDQQLADEAALIEVRRRLESLIDTSLTSYVIRRHSIAVWSEIVELLEGDR